MSLSSVLVQESKRNRRDTKRINDNPRGRGKKGGVRPYPRRREDDSLRGCDPFQGGRRGSSFYKKEDRVTESQTEIVG